MSFSECFTYISAKAGADPVRLVFLCAPAGSCETLEATTEFARASGWVRAVEDGGAALVAPVVPGGWAAAPKGLLHSLYGEARGYFRVAEGRGIPGKNDVAWVWEVLLGLVGYGEGACFAADYVAAHPSFCAASVLVGGQMSDFSVLNEPSDHWFVAEPSEFYAAPANKDVPVAVWFIGEAADEATVAALARRGAPEGCVRVDADDVSAEEGFAARALDYLSHAIRWKSGPDGRLAWHHTAAEFDVGNTYHHRSVTLRGIEYPYALHLPCGMSTDDARDLPLVLSIHGRGEPAWIFSDKNGWERLADETRGFAVALPDSPGNIWMDSRDAGVAAAVAADAVGAFGLDASRVYITGFSNGAVYTAQQATAHPENFAAASSWNGPGLEAVAAGGMGDHVFAEGFARSAAEMPFWICFGSADGPQCRDHEGDLAHVLAPNGCCGDDAVVWDGDNHYLKEFGYAEGDRLTSRVFMDAEGCPRVGITEVRDLPHGAIADEARAAWEFMKRFRRPEGSCKVEVLES
ncbi:PHB depolymerase family esterase [Paratractidigestivibacter sp.]|uniref:PHB depolymerase family esterase n=1 Tax=Paratractidigestivibacter sp. TaxID=2847316 RepID=UPI002AC99A55|nr:PHB depolymerase family esterase [Paratractidigestivibacter sp.]